MTVYQIPITDEMTEARLQAIHFVQNGLRLPAALYVVWRHAEVLAKRDAPGLAIFGHPYMADVMEIAAQSSARAWDAAGGTAAFDAE